LPQFSCIFIDINMPGMNGKDLTRELRSRESEGELDLAETKLVCLTTMDEAEVGDIQEIGFTHYVQKPIKWIDIKSVLNEEH